MKRKMPFFLLIFISFFLSSCNDDKKEDIEEILNILEPELIFPSSGGELIFNIESNTKWDIGVNTWCRTSPLSGDGNKQITVKVAENTRDVIRTTHLSVKTQTQTKTIKIKQEATPPIIIPDPEGLHFPLLTIKTENGKPVDSKDVYVNATITIESRNEKGEVINKLYEGATEIKGRGNSTWGMEKKPYRLKLDKSSGLLEMPKNKHWVLLANYSDKTLMRNELAFEISRRMGFTYTPRMKYVDVILNGNYIGNYMLGEHIRIDKNRVNIAELAANETEDITGGYLLEIDSRKGEPVWFETEKGKMTFCVSRPEDIPDNQKEYISNYIQNIENILYAKDGVDPTKELPKYLHMKSFIDYLLLNELSKNVDGNLRLSTYVYKDKGDDKLYFGPVWDYDIAFGNVNYDGCDKTDGWHARSRANWYKEFFKHEEFNKMVNDRWKELRENELRDVDTFIDQLAKDLEMSQKENFKRWQILNKYVWPNAVIPGSYPGEIKYLKDWLSKRLTWMDQQLK